MAQYLHRNSDSLSSLPYQQIDLRLVACGVITIDKKRQIDCAKHDRKCQMKMVLSEIQSSLYLKQPKKFKTFLQILEISGDYKLEKIAERLG